MARKTKTETFPTVDKFLSYRLSVLSRLINRRSTRYFSKRYGLSLAEWRCLAQISMGEATMIRDIAERTNSDKAQISRAALKLSKKGLIVSKENKDDGRSNTYSATTEGKRLYNRILPLRAAENQTVMDVLSKSDQKKLLEYLDRIMGYLSEEEVEKSNNK